MCVCVLFFPPACCTQTYSIPSISGSSAFPALPQNLGLTLTAYQILHFTAFFFFLPTLQSAGNIIHIFIPLQMQVSFWICSLHARPCLLPAQVKRPQNCPNLVSMCTISIDSPSYVKSAVNTRRAARRVLFMNMCPWRHPLSSAVTKL